MDKGQSRFTTIEAILMGAKAFAPLIAIVVVEQVKGPGYSASAKETFWYATTMILVLGILAPHGTFRKR